MRTSWIRLALVVASALIVPSGHAAKLPACSGGRYFVSGAPLMPGLDASSPDVVDMTGHMVAVLSGCDPVRAKIRASRKGTKIRARWKACPAITGKATLRATITDDCHAMAATFTAKTAGIARPFLASLSSCGDGIWDPAAGEACDGLLGPCGDVCNACTCGGVTTTTSPGGTTSSTTPALPTTSTTTTTLATPDLAEVGWMSPMSAPTGTAIAVEFTVKNVGTATASGSWYDYVMFSSDYAFGGDTAIAVTQRSSSLSAGSQYTVLVPLAQLPAVPAGTYYLYLQTDGTNAVAESNESNNIGAFVQINITP